MRISLLATLILLAVSAFGQTADGIAGGYYFRTEQQISMPVKAPAPVAQTQPANFYAAGVSYNNSGSPSVAGTGMYAHLISDKTGSYAFTVVDALPSSFKPFTVTSSFSAGLSQKIVTIGKVPIFIPTAAGVSYSGSNVGWAWSTGALASFKVKNNWRIFPNVRIVKSSVSNGAGYQPVVGIMFGYGD